MSIIGERAKQRREELGLSQEDLVKRINSLFGARTCSQPKYGQLETGETAQPRYIFELATALDVSVFWLRGETDDSDPIGGERLSPKMVAVAGYVGAGAEVYPFDDHALGDGLEMVPPPPGVDAASVVAVKVRGDSMYPVIRNGWILFYTRSCDGVLDECINEMCVCQIEDGPTVVKDVRRGTIDGTFTLTSWNAPPIENVRLSWASIVRDIRTRK